ncbi:MIZ zinc finger family protein [Histomonas meleagridis]|uniref:MIZ zinc finger family protein n=1 Tax=Histomonas meleagridis TaxID=135588 RepID=UPI003559445E|nr:MIZ zinc finger family protein [Histomonas meleagridis]KAH0796125.1 MIZ zinc finger family protein [Histomonas meleagridis]
MRNGKDAPNVNNANRSFMYLTSFQNPHQNPGFPNSPLIPSSSLPMTTGVWGAQNPANPRPQNPTSDATYIYRQFSDIRTPYVYPSIVVNGMLRDVNEIVRFIVSNHSFPPQINDNSEVSTIDQATHVPIICPGRGIHCTHSQCFDIPEFLIMQNPENPNWICPICSAPLSIETICYDPMFFKTKREVNSIDPSQQRQDDVFNAFLPVF